MALGLAQGRDPEDGFVSLRHRRLAAIDYQLTAEDAEADVVISSELLHCQPLAAESADPRSPTVSSAACFTRPERIVTACARPSATGRRALAWSLVAGQFETGHG
jgi:hypothetical protein